MTIAEMIEWLKQFPKDKEVNVLSHTSGGGYYDQGGNCYVEPFHNKVEYQQWKDEGDETPVDYVYGEHFEYHRKYNTLQIGVKDK